MTLPSIQILIYWWMFGNRYTMKTMKKELYIFISSFLPCMMVNAQVSQPRVNLNSDSLIVQKIYKVDVFENANSPLAVTHSAKNGNKGFFQDLWKVTRSSYINTATGITVDTSKDLITATIGFLKESLRSKKNDWYKQVMSDNRYTEALFMDEQVKDFYGSDSHKGALDPDSIIFDGFGCRQYMTITENSGGSSISNDVPIIDIRCSLRKDSIGLARMRHHGMFDVVVDYVKINPYLCNLPNDSLVYDDAQNQYMKFDFNRRKNFRVSLSAKIQSSWLNEAIILNTDQVLGNFKIDITIPDSTYLEKDDEHIGYFIYERPESTNSQMTEQEIKRNKRNERLIRLSGESFLIPRTFIGYDEERHGIWGTGQYAVNMTIQESCDINMDYYVERIPKRRHSIDNHYDTRYLSNGEYKERWNYNWKREWNLMKHRHPKKNPYAMVWDNLKMKFAGDRWINILIDTPVKFTLESESAWVKENLEKLLDPDKRASNDR